MKGLIYLNIQGSYCFYDIISHETDKKVTKVILHPNANNPFYESVDDKSLS